jgi:hypothetical protein
MIVEETSDSMKRNDRKRKVILGSTTRVCRQAPALYFFLKGFVYNIYGDRSFGMEEFLNGYYYS